MGLTLWKNHLFYLKKTELNVPISDFKHCMVCERYGLLFPLTNLLPPPRRQVGLSVILSVSNITAGNQSILLKVGTMIGPTNLKNWLTFGGDPVPDTDYGSLFPFPRHFVIKDFRRFINLLFRERSGRHPDPSGNSDSNHRSLSVKVRRLGGGLRSLSTVC